MKIEETVEKWINLSAQLSSIKEQELELRNKICSHILKDKLKGSKKATIGRYVLNATAKLNQKIDKELLETIWEDLSPEEKAAVKFNPSLVAKEYKKLSEKSLLNRAIDSKPGTPSLDLKGTLE